MAFSRLTVKVRYDRAEGRCECQQLGHGHHGRCPRPLIWWHYGRLAPDGWLAVPRVPLDTGGSDDAENALAVCWECYEQGLQEAGRAA